MLSLSLLFLTLFTLSFGRKQNVFRNEKILSKERNSKIKTVFGKYVVFFDLECLAIMTASNRDIIQEFLDQFECYQLNDTVIDLYPNTVDHWIYMERIKKCGDEDEKQLEFMNYCIIDIEQDETGDLYSSLANECKSRTVETALWNLNSASPSIASGVEYIEYNSQFITGIDIIVMDSGIDSSHSEFDGITYQRIHDSFPSDTTLDAHGTGVASIIVGENYGVFRAKNSDTKLLDVRIFNGDGDPETITNYLNAYDAILIHLNQNSDRKAVINFSFGTSDWHEFVPRLENIRRAGGIMIAAAGNTNEDTKYYSPTASPDTISVGAHTRYNERWSNSNYGDLVDIWAPGSEIKLAIPGEGSLTTDGTSLAAPFVAGIVANILANNQNLDFYGVKAKLLSYAVRDLDDNLGNTDLPRAQISCLEYQGGVATGAPNGDDYSCGFEVLSNDHSVGDIGKYFNFDVDTVDCILGGSFTDSSLHWVFHSGSNERRQVRLWRNNNGGSIGSGHGRIEPSNDANSGDWNVGDLIKFDGINQCDCIHDIYPCSFQILSNDHSFGDIGKYFNFDISAVDCILGEEFTNSGIYNVFYSGTNTVRSVKLWRNNNGGSSGSGHGRIAPSANANAGDWETGEFIAFHGSDVSCGCSNNGLLYIYVFICCFICFAKHTFFV